MDELLKTKERKLFGNSNSDKHILLGNGVLEMLMMLISASLCVFRTIIY